MANIMKVEGIGESYAEKLAVAGIKTTQTLLAQGASAKGRREISQQTGINEKLILRWVNHVDLFRIKGVGEEYADLLEAAGVDTVPELAQRNPDNLQAKMTAVNAEKRLVRQLPAARQIAQWITQAKTLPRIITY
jgi:predicted flap endonuclease-1-like 5' DNA nuclease